MSKDFPYELTAHAGEVVAEREIPLSWVARTLEQPEKTQADSEDEALQRALARIPEHGNRVLRVVYNWKTAPWRVITAYFDRSQRSGL